MGATDFQIAEAGKDAREAYEIACKEAAYEHGHQGGYSGDIQCTRGFRLCHKPSSVPASKWAGWLWDAEEGSASKVPSQHRSAVAAQARGLQKWGPALAVEITGKELKEFKERRGLKGTRKKGFLFLGIAAC